MNDKNLGLGCISIGVVIAIFVLVGGFILFQPGSLLGYWAWGVGSDEIGVELDRGVFTGVLGPGYYSAPFELGADIQNVSMRAVEFLVVDQQVLTRAGIDQQTLTVDVSFNVVRPGIGFLDAMKWQKYRSLLTDRESLLNYVNPAAAEAIRACFNSTAFQEAIGGTGRDTLSTCITERLTASLADAGLKVERLLIANVDPSEAAMQRLEEIRDVNQQIDLANANAELVEAQADRDAEAERGKIMVTAAAVEAQYNAQATQAVAEQRAIEAQQSVLDAQATYDASELLYQQAQAEIKRQIALIDAQASYADEAALAAIYQQFPTYANLVSAELISRGLANVQWGYLQPGQTPLQTIIGADGSLGHVIANPNFQQPLPTATLPAQ